MAHVKSAISQPHRPAAVESPAAAVAAAQGIGAVAYVLHIAFDRAGKGGEESTYRGVGAACQVLSGLGAMAQRLKEQSVAVGIVQAVETGREVCKERREIRPRSGRLDGQRQDEIPVVAELRIALIAEQAQRRTLERDAVLIVRRLGQQGFAALQSRSCIADTELRRGEKAAGGQAVW